MQTNTKTWLIVGNGERLSEASVYKDATSTVHAVYPSLRGAFLYWMQSVTSTVDVPSWEKNKPWLLPVFPSHFPTLHTADNSSWAVFTYLPVQKKQFFTFTESECSQNPPLRFIVSQFWPSHEEWQTDWFCTRPGPQGWWVSVLNWGIWLVPRTVARESRFPVGKPIHTWLALPGIIWPSSVGRTLQNIILWLKNRNIRFPLHS